MNENNEKCDEEYNDLKECISNQIFNFDGNGYIKPSKEDCHRIADNIIEIIGV